MNQITLGVVVPVFGEFEHIKTCIESLDTQSVSWDSKVAVLDCIRDTKTLEFFSGLGDWIVIENAEPLGIIESTEIGIDHCEAEFVALVDCDDVLHPKAVETIVSIVNSEDCREVALLSFRYKISECVDSEWEFWAKQEIIASNDDDRPLLSDLYGSDSQLLLDNAVASHLKVYRKSMICSVPSSYHGVQDAVLTHLVCLKGAVRFRPEVLYLYRLHANQASKIQEISQVRKINSYRSNYLHRGLNNPARVRLLNDLAPWFRQVRGELDHGVFVVLQGCKVERVDFLTFSAWDEVSHRLDLGSSVIFSTREWFEFGALSGFSDPDFPSTLILDQSGATLDDVAKWYGGYFDAILLASKTDATVLAQYCPHQLMLAPEAVQPTLR